MSTALKITWNNDATTNISHINESCADAVLAQFAYKVADLSTLTIDSVEKVDEVDITNAESDTEPVANYALWTPSAEFYDINNEYFVQALTYGFAIPDAEDRPVKILSYEIRNNKIYFTCELANGDEEEFSAIYFRVLGHTVQFTKTIDGEIQTRYRSAHTTIERILIELGWTAEQFAELIMQNKAVKIFVDLYQNWNTSSSGTVRCNVTYVEDTNSIRVDPVDGVTDDFGISINDPAAVLDEEDEVLPYWITKQLIGVNVEKYIGEELAFRIFLQVGNIFPAD